MPHHVASCFIMIHHMRQAASSCCITRRYTLYHVYQGLGKLSFLHLSLQCVSQAAECCHEVSAKKAMVSRHTCAACCKNHQRAMSLLASHLAANSDSETAHHGALSTKGAAKREKLQQELSSRSGNYLPRIAQQAHRRMVRTHAPLSKVVSFTRTSSSTAAIRTPMRRCGSSPTRLRNRIWWGGLATVRDTAARPEVAAKRTVELYGQ